MSQHFEFALATDSEASEGTADLGGGVSAASDFKLPNPRCCRLASVSTGMWIGLYGKRQAACIPPRLRRCWRRCEFCRLGRPRKNMLSHWPVKRRVGRQWEIVSIVTSLYIQVAMHKRTPPLNTLPLVHFIPPRPHIPSPPWASTPLLSSPRSVCSSLTGTCVQRQLIDTRVHTKRQIRP